MPFYQHYEHGLIEAHVFTDLRATRDRILKIGQGQVSEGNGIQTITYLSGLELAILKGDYVIKSEKGIWSTPEFNFKLACHLGICKRIQDPETYPWM